MWISCCWKCVIEHPLSIIDNEFVLISLLREVDGQSRRSFPSVTGALPLQMDCLLPAIELASHGDFMGVSAINSKFMLETRQLGWLLL